MKRTYLPAVALVGALFIAVGLPHRTVTLVAGLGMIAGAIGYDARMMEALSARLAPVRGRHLPYGWHARKDVIAEWQSAVDAAIAAEARTLRNAIATELRLLKDPIAYIAPHPNYRTDIDALGRDVRTARRALRTLHRLARYYGFRVRNSYKDYLLP
jgi:hypothetical protein